MTLTDDPMTLAIYHLERCVRGEVVGEKSQFHWHTMLYCLQSAQITGMVALALDANLLPVLDFGLCCPAMRMLIVLKFLFPQVHVDNNILLFLINENVKDRSDRWTQLLLIEVVMRDEVLWKKNRQHIIAAVNRLQSYIPDEVKAVRTKTECKKTIQRLCRENMLQRR